jgi:hypothetical protein
LAPTAVLAGGKKGPPDGFFDSDRTIEYDPQKGLELNRSDEKFVVVLASNPDEIVSQIRQFAASDNAKKILTQFTDTVVQSRNQEVVQKQASLTLGVGQDQVVVTAAQDALKQLQGTPTRGTALSAVESVLAIMGKQ